MKTTTKQDKLLNAIEVISKQLKFPIGKLTNSNDQISVTGKISDYQFWLHDDGGAYFSSDWYDRVFEIYDFPNHQQLIEAFASSLSDAIEKREYYKLNPEKSPKPTLNRFFDFLVSIWKSKKRDRGTN